MWTALPLEKSRSPATVNKLSKPRHNSRTKLCIELSLIHNRDNVELYLHCKFQSSPFSVRRKNGVTDRLTDRQNDRQRDYSMPRGSAHRGIMTDNAITVSLVPRPRLPKLRRGPGTHCVRMRRNSRNSRNHRIFSVHDRYTLRHRSWRVEQVSRLLCCMHSSASDDTKARTVSQREPCI